MYNWTPLREEFAIWQDLGLRLPMWWRDDDAVTPTPALERLRAVSNDIGIPVHLAVIPDHVHPELGPFVQGADTLRAITHGWTHTSHSLPPQKSSEFGAHRARADVQHDITRGHRVISAMFGSSFTPVFAPAWNRFYLGHAPCLAQAGYTALSLYKPRIWQWAAPGTALINTHVDPIAWRSTRALCPPDEIIARVVKLLRDRRMGYTDAAEPLGYLTHHLDHNEDIWYFSQAFLAVMREGPVDIAPPVPDAVTPTTTDTHTTTGELHT